MITDLTITDLTNMHANRICVAAVNAQMQSIRPLFRNRNIFREWCFQGEQIIQPFSRVQLDLIEHIPRPPHSEDWIVDDDYLRVLGILENREKRNFIETTLSPQVPSIFGAPIQCVEGEGTFVSTGQGIRSLGTIKTLSISNFSHVCYDGNWDYRINFVDQVGNNYRLKIVDLTFQAYVDHHRNNHNANGDLEERINQKFAHRDTFLRIGLARNWGRFPNRCYLQITGVYTFPDYLVGRCFADFNDHQDQEDDIPF